MRRLALTTLAIVMSGAIASLPSSANAAVIHPGSWVRAGHGGDHGHNVLKGNNNKKIGNYAPSNIVDSPTIIKGTQHVNSVSQNTSTQSASCKKKRICKISQNMWAKANNN
ncbi:hypothetical protein [Planotetraspora sp. GP83]|uniref:hypothetical protein n=1 Tax=Planotetraspora sp. GP83 TaxID=3156264 RepID=UPI0035124D92